jgi:Domain of unknown function (DUF4383)
MAKTIATIMGALFILIGLVGFASNNFLGTHLTPAHNVIHLISGAASLYFGLKGSMSAAKAFCLIFGLVYLGLAVVGYFLGTTGTTDLPGAEAMGGVNERMFRVIPGVLAFGTMDHLVHLIIGAVYLIGGVLTSTSLMRFPEGDRE